LSTDVIKVMAGVATGAILALMVHLIWIKVKLSLWSRKFDRKCDRIQENQKALRARIREAEGKVNPIDPDRYVIDCPSCGMKEIGFLFEDSTVKCPRCFSSWFGVYDGFQKVKAVKVKETDE